MKKKIYTNRIREDIIDIKAGDEAYLNGIIYTARDAAHKKLSEMISKNISLPFDIKDSVIYYAGPTSAPKINPLGIVVGSCGPTTSKRMDLYTPELLKMGLACTIGKGGRNPEICDAMKEYGAVYLCAIGGAGAIYSNCIKSIKTIAFEELGCESVKELEVRDFPVYMAFDIWGNSIFTQPQAGR
ncbi:MAG: FumA C-terminus/TtdB family hydratase beta subunit [Oscillospiraceae bacterium]|nr:FumA C-terminus/TtdB family hydratase beta subunit [Oscillospiraceae bacterium]